jgi:hypothetical protein
MMSTLDISETATAKQGRVCRHGEIVPAGGSCPRCREEERERYRRRGTADGSRLRLGPASHRRSCGRGPSLLRRVRLGLSPTWPLTTSTTFAGSAGAVTREGGGGRVQPWRKARADTRASHQISLRVWEKRQRRNHGRRYGLPGGSAPQRLGAGSGCACALAEGMDDSPAYAKGQVGPRTARDPRRAGEGRALPEPQLARGPRAMSDAVDEHVAKALASLADVSTRQLHATAEALAALSDSSGRPRELLARRGSQ